MSSSARSHATLSALKFKLHPFAKPLTLTLVDPRSFLSRSSLDIVVFLLLSSSNRDFRPIIPGKPVRPSPPSLASVERPKQAEGRQLSVGMGGRATCTVLAQMVKSKTLVGLGAAVISRLFRSVCGARLCPSLIPPPAAVAIRRQIERTREAPPLSACCPRRGGYAGALARPRSEDAVMVRQLWEAPLPPMRLPRHAGAAITMPTLAWECGDKSLGDISAVLVEYRGRYITPLRWSSDGDISYPQALVRTSSSGFFLDHLQWCVSLKYYSHTINIRICNTLPVFLTVRKSLFHAERRLAASRDAKSHSDSAEFKRIHAELSKK
ncbi:hypothetical protein C8R47DRAFT_1084237 [Mycena vitilis]|nr:hypothetical protein C8R47DRAFT_1084237 [Mycena vitilis]